MGEARDAGIEYVLQMAPSSSWGKSSMAERMVGEECSLSWEGVMWMGQVPGRGHYIYGRGYPASRARSMNVRLENAPVARIMRTRKRIRTA
jgi:hypothetical protein